MVSVDDTIAGGVTSVIIRAAVVASFVEKENSMDSASVSTRRSNIDPVCLVRTIWFQSPAPSSAAFPSNTPTVSCWQDTVPVEGEGWWQVTVLVPVLVKLFAADWARVQPFLPRYHLHTAPAVCKTPSVGASESCQGSGSYVLVVVGGGVSVSVVVVWPWPRPRLDVQLQPEPNV